MPWNTLMLTAIAVAFYVYTYRVVYNTERTGFFVLLIFFIFSMFVWLGYENIPPELKHLDGGYFWAGIVTALHSIVMGLVGRVWIRRVTHAISLGVVIVAGASLLILPLVT